MSVRCVACDLHKTAPWPNEYACWKQSAVLLKKKNLKWLLSMPLFIFFTSFVPVVLLAAWHRLCQGGGHTEGVSTTLVEMFDSVQVQTHCCDPQLVWLASWTTGHLFILSVGCSSLDSCGHSPFVVTGLLSMLFMVICLLCGVVNC